MTKVRPNQAEIEEILNDPAAFATETRKGTAELATQAEVDAGISLAKMVTPNTLSNFSGLVGSLDGLSDVVLSGSPAVATNEVLKYNGSVWTNAVDAGLQNIVEDLSPQLGADLDTNGFNIITPDGITTNSILIKTGNITAVNTNTTGYVSIQAGSGYSTGNNGGYISLVGGYGQSTGGDVQIYAGASNSSNAGKVSITGGFSAIGNSGGVFLSGGTSVIGTGAIASIAGGTGVTGGGSVELKAGYSSGTSGVPGSVDIVSGNGTGLTSIGGDINLTAGYGSTSDGSVIVYAPDQKVGVGSIGFRRDTNTSHTTGNTITLQASSSLVSDVVLTLPIDDGTTGQSLTTDGSGLLSWATVSASTNNWLIANGGIDFATAPAVGSPPDNGIALGNAASIAAGGNNSSSIVIGDNATVTGTGSYNSIAVGKYANISGTGSGYSYNSIAVGYTATITGTYTYNSIAIGNGATISGTGLYSYNSIAIGTFADITGPNTNRSIVLGYSAKSTNRQSISIGAFTANASYGQTLVGYGVLSDNTPRRSIFGYGDNTALGTTTGYQSLISTFGKGKVELYGAEAQFILPNYLVGVIPATTNEGGMIWDSTNKELKIYDGTAFTGVGASNNWLTANNGLDFGNASTAVASRSIALGDNATAGDGTVAIGKDSIAIGSSAWTNTASGDAAIAIGRSAIVRGDYSIGIGGSCRAESEGCISIGKNAAGGFGGLTHQTVIGGDSLFSNLTKTDVSFSVKIGSGFAIGHPDNSFLHLFSKGKLELYGDDAQFILPNYLAAGSPLIPIPLTTDEGGMIWDASTKELKIYDGTSFAAVGGGGGGNNWLTANGGNDFVNAPTSGDVGDNNIALGDYSKVYAPYTSSIAVGTYARVGDNSSIALGNYAKVASGYSSVAIGDYAQILGGGNQQSIAIGNSAIISGSSYKSIAIGNSAYVSGSSYKSIAVGYTSQALHPQTISIGNETITSANYQVLVGTGIQSDTTLRRSIFGFGDYLALGSNVGYQSLISVFEQGKVELYGNNAQFILPNYLVGSPALPAIPLTTNEGGMIWDASTKELKIYDGTSFAAVGGGGGGLANIVEDLTPQLGGNLDTNGFNIITTNVSGANALYVNVGGGGGGNFGGDFSLYAGRNSTGNYAGNIFIEAGGNTYNNAGSYSGQVVIKSGYTVAGLAYGVTIQGGSTSGPNGTIGPTSIYAGNGINNTGGELAIKSGNGNAGDGGPINITAGVSNTGTGGAVTVLAGYSATGVAGHIILRGGDAANITPTQSGSVKIYGGGHPNSIAGAIELHGPFGKNSETIVQFWDDAVSNYVALKAPAFTGSPLTNITFTLPQLDGSNGDVLTTDGTGGMTWAPASGGGGGNNWLTANAGSNFTTAPNSGGATYNNIALGNAATVVGAYQNNIALGTSATVAGLTNIGSIAIGDNASISTYKGYQSVAIGQASSVSGSYNRNGIAIGTSATVGGSYNYNSTAIGYNTTANFTNSISIGGYSVAGAVGQTTIGYGITSDASVNRSIFGHGNQEALGYVGGYQSLISVFGKGKVELYGDEAQFILPNYLAGSPALPAIPLTTDEGGMIWDASTKELKIYNGTSFSAVGGGGLFSENADNSILGGTGAGANLVAGQGLDNFLGGVNAGNALTLGDDNIFIGNNSAEFGTGKFKCVSIGRNAWAGVSGDGGNYFDGVFVGFEAGRYSLSSNDTFIGSGSGSGTATLRNTSPGGNTGVGRYALRYSKGSLNTAVGMEALHGDALPALGVIGSGNVAIGYRAGFVVEGFATNNTLIGRESGLVLEDGDNNTAIGYRAGSAITTGSSNVCIGQNAGPGTGTLSNQLFIDNLTTDNPLIHGNFGTNVVTINGALIATGGVDALTSATTTVDVSAATAPTVGQVLTATSGTAATWQTPSSGISNPLTADLDTGGFNIITATASGANADDITITGGTDAPTFAAGNININGGYGAGNVNISAGNYSGNTNNGGVVTITAGTSAGTGGTVIIQNQPGVGNSRITVGPGSTMTIDGTVDCNNNDLDNVKTVTFNSEIPNITTSQLIDWKVGQKQKSTITAATTITFGAPIGVCNLTLQLINGGAGAITWPAAVKWPGGTEPTWTTPTGSPLSTEIDIVSFYFDGTNYYGMAGLAFA